MRTNLRGLPIKRCDRVIVCVGLTAATDFGSGVLHNVRTKIVAMRRSSRKLHLTVWGDNDRCILVAMLKTNARARRAACIVESTGELDSLRLQHALRAIDYDAVIGPQLPNTIMHEMILGQEGINRHQRHREPSLFGKGAKTSALLYTVLDT